MCGNEYILILLILKATVSLGFLQTGSRLVIAPQTTKAEDDFGFSIAFQNNSRGEVKLIVGSPHGNLDGSVHSCTITPNPKCTKLDIDVKKATKTTITKRIMSSQSYCLGATVAATSDYIWTCAPLWTKIVPHAEVPVFGACFVYYNDTDVRPYQGLLNQKYTLKESMGTTGWSTLLEPSSDMILIGRPSISVYGDIVYLPSSQPDAPVRSLVSTNQKNNKKDVTENHNFVSQYPNNIGSAFAYGEFFSKHFEYAFSMQDRSTAGYIAFLTQKKQEGSLIIKRHEGEPVVISSHAPGSMYGAALLGADVDVDGWSDLLVGAPAHSDSASYETGAVFMYRGGSVELMKDQERMRVIFGVKDGGRFGAAILAYDLDGDSLPEILISAPYEDSGLGAVYIISGYEVNHRVLRESSCQISLTDLQLTQRLQVEGARSFGYSLIVLPAATNEYVVAVGAPGSSQVIMYEVMTPINVTLVTELLDKVVTEYDKSFAVSVCLHVTYKSNPNNLTTDLFVANTIIGSGAKIDRPKFNIHLSQNKEVFCENIVVRLSYNDSGSYNFTVSLVTNEVALRVYLTPYSKTTDSVLVTRVCAENDCTPKLDVQLLFEESSSNLYVVGDNATTRARVTVHNTGGSVYDACVRLSVVHARVLSVPCSADNDLYKCHLPKPLQRNEQTSIDILINMTRSTSDYGQIQIKALLYQNCNHKNFTQISMNVNLLFDTDTVFVQGLTRDFNITDTEIMEHKLETVNATQEYRISNAGSLLWENVSAIVSFSEQSYFSRIWVSNSQNSACLHKEEINVTTFICPLRLWPHSTEKIFISFEILTKVVLRMDNEKIVIQSDYTLYLKPTNKTIVKRLSTIVFYQKELSWANNKTLIVTIAVTTAILVLAATSYTLYKLRFFKRKVKSRLDVLKENVRRQSMRHVGDPQCDEQGLVKEE